MAMANTKNRAGVAQLRTELKRIEREKNNELRMHNNEKQRFQARLSKSGYSPHSSVNEFTEFQASDVKMYETHIPGFCYKRNGDHKLLQPPTVNPPVDFEHLHFLLFTDGEVDIEKVLCLHLLSTHHTEHLTPPIRPKTISNIVYKKHSPVENLIERSKKKHNQVVAAMLLPTYVLDVRGKENTSNVNLIKDGRLTARLLVNDKVLELITTVVTTLNQSNPEKVKQLVELAEDPSSLKRIFRKPHIQDFVKLLKDHSIICSCCSFTLTKPFKITPARLEIRTKSGNLENLVKYIRQNVLQLPNRSTWKKFTEPSKEAQSEPAMSKASSKFNEFQEDVSKFRHSSTNFVMKNITALTNYKKNNVQEPPKPPRKRSSEQNSIPRRNSEVPPSTRQEKRKSDDDGEDIKYHLKQTTCSACMEKWKTPLPSPKVGTIKKIAGVENEEEGSMLRPNSTQKIAMMIEKELYKLNSYDRKYSSNNRSNASFTTRRSTVAKDYLDIVRLDVYDLEKIKQEIREKEAKKKMEKFLCNC